MSPMDLQHLNNLIRNYKTFQVGSRGCSFLCTYMHGKWSIWVDRARLSMTVDRLCLSMGAHADGDEYGNMMIGYHNGSITFELNLTEYIKITEDLPRRGAE